MCFWVVDYLLGKRPSSSASCPLAAEAVRAVIDQQAPRSRAATADAVMTSTCTSWKPSCGASHWLDKGIGLA